MEAYPCKKETYLYQVTTYYQLPFNMFRIVKSLTPLDYMKTVNLDASIPPDTKYTIYLR